MNNLSPFEQGISLWCNVEDTSNILPLWPLFPLKLCSCALSSSIGLFSRYASDKYLFLESWEEEWLPLWVCLPYLFCKMNIVLPYNDPWTCSCIKLMQYQASWSKRYVNNEIKNHEQNINQVHPVQNVCSSCTTPMYINIMQCAKRYHPWNVSIICLYQHANMCIYQYANMCIYQYANHVYLPTRQTMYHITHDMSPSLTKCHNQVSQTNANYCANQVVPMV